MVASDFGWVGWVTRKFGLVPAVNVADVKAFAAAIKSVLDKPAESGGSVAAKRFREYHTIQNQKAHWAPSLGHERGVPLGELVARIDWSQVIAAAI